MIPKNDVDPVLPRLCKEIHVPVLGELLLGVADGFSLHDVGTHHHCEIHIDARLLESALYLRNVDFGA